MKFREMKTQEIEKALQTNSYTGLSDEEVKDWQSKYGFNELQEGEKQSLFYCFLLSLRILWYLFYWLRR